MDPTPSQINATASAPYMKMAGSRNWEFGAPPPAFELKIRSGISRAQSPPASRVKMPKMTKPILRSLNPEGRGGGFVIGGYSVADDTDANYFPLKMFVHS
jgi:hypothetical protein